MPSEKDIVEEARQLLGATTQGPLKLLRYDHGGGRLRHAESSTLVADFYHEGDRELYYRAPELLRALADEVERLRGEYAVASKLKTVKDGLWDAAETELDEIRECDKCDLCEDHC